VIDFRLFLPKIVVIDERNLIMFSRRFFCAFALSVTGLLLPARFAAAQDSIKIATVNPAKVFNEMQETKDLKQKMESDRQAIQTEGKRRSDELDEAKKARGLFREDSEDFNKKNQEMIKKAVELQVWQELIKADLLRQQKSQMKNLFEKIEAATKEVAETKKLDLVIVEQRIDLPTDPNTMEQINVDQLRGLINQRTVMYNNAKFDITNDVLAVVDGKYKSRK
jgi:Skp family chaperone for outer membrane proteins